MRMRGTYQFKQNVIRVQEEYEASSGNPDDANDYKKEHTWKRITPMTIWTKT